MYARISILEKRTEKFPILFFIQNIHLFTFDFVMPNSIQLPLLIKIIELLIILKNDDNNT